MSSLTTGCCRRDRTTLRKREQLTCLISRQTPRNPIHVFTCYDGLLLIRPGRNKQLKIQTASSRKYLPPISLFGCQTSKNYRDTSAQATLYVAVGRQCVSMLVSHSSVYSLEPDTPSTHILTIKASHAAILTFKNGDVPWRREELIINWCLPETTLCYVPHR